MRYSVRFCKCTSQTLENVATNISQSLLRAKKVKTNPSFLPRLRRAAVAPLGSALESWWPRRGGWVPAWGLCGSLGELWKCAARVWRPAPCLCRPYPAVVLLNIFLSLQKEEMRCGCMYNVAACKICSHALLDFFFFFFKAPRSLICWQVFGFGWIFFFFLNFAAFLAENFLATHC